MSNFPAEFYREGHDETEDVEVDGGVVSPKEVFIFIPMSPWEDTSLGAAFFLASIYDVGADDVISGGYFADTDAAKRLPVFP